MKRVKCVLLANLKGGTGKTTSCISIAGFLAQNERKVLVVDFDPQANATSGLGIEEMTLKYSIYDAILAHCDGYSGVPLSDVIVETAVKNLHLVPSELDLGVAEALMQTSRNRSDILDLILEEVRPMYDYILIDAPPSSGLLMINSLCASQQLLIPVDPGVFSLESLEGMKTIVYDVKRINKHPMDRVLSILTRYRRPSGWSRVLGRHNPSQEIGERLRELFDVVFIVPESDQIYRAHKEGIPISHYAPSSAVGSAYERIAEELCAYTQQKKAQKAQGKGDA